VLAVLVLTGPPAAPAAYAPAKNGDIFYARSEGPIPDIWMISGAGTGMRNITQTPTLAERAPAISPTGSHLAYSSYDGVTDFDIVLRRLPGGPVVNLTSEHATTQESSPAFSPDGRLIAYEATTGGQNDIFVMNADGSAPRNLTNTPSDSEAHASFSPDGRTIVFSRFGIGTDIWAMNADGSGARNLTQTAPPVGEFLPAFSPDGRRITFVRVATGCEVFAMNADGSGAVNLTESAADECDPTYSADGRKIVYDRSDMGQLDLWTMRADGSGQGNLTKTPAPANEERGAWESVFTCAGRRATIVGDAGPDKIKGTKKRDVIVANAGKDVVRGRGGKDLICLGAGRDRAVGGGGTDLCRGGKGKDKAKGCELGKP
jgi:dipeptidyl aminopeptidase/acylaminoacyl peptidase